jgi:hypothetical protein
LARRDRNARFTALLHHVGLGRLPGGVLGDSPAGRTGVDGVTWAEYGQDLEANVLDGAEISSGS